MKAELAVTPLSPFLSNGTEDMSHTNTNQKQAEAVRLVADEENFGRTQGKERCCVVTENSTHKEDKSNYKHICITHYSFKIQKAKFQTKM